jgi:hypothetical protein
VRTPWVMSLDNDIVFIKNPLAAIQNDLAALGCHFMALTLLSSDSKTNLIRGGHLHVSFDMEHLILGGGSAFPADFVGQEGPGFLCTFMPGGACVFRKDSFVSLGGFDENMFVGFEDFEFSLRLFQSGLKVGSCEARALAHDHPKPSSSVDRDYEQVRHHHQLLEESARWFEGKHAFTVWTPLTEKWLQQREQELNIASAPSSRCASSPLAEPLSQRPRITLVADVVDWALSNVARQLVKHLSDEFDFEVLTSCDIERPSLILEMTKGQDLVHYLWRGPLNLVTDAWNREFQKTLYGSVENFIQETVRSRPVTLTVFDHLYLDPPGIEAWNPIINSWIHGYTVSSKKLAHIYAAIPGFRTPDAVTTDGVDLGLFCPGNTARFEEAGSRPLRVGWVGNSQWGSWSAETANDHKGFHTILLPAIDSLRSSGYSIEGCFADRQTRYVPHEEMPEYYRSIDALVCVSENEGTPNPVLEAMACGVPVISTDVGIVAEALGKRQREFILPDRSVSALISALKRLLASPEDLRMLSKENEESVKLWSWSIRSEAYRSFFRMQRDSWSGCRARPGITEGL